MAEKKRGPMLVGVIIVITAAIGAASWYSSSFKRGLTDDQILERLSSDASPRDVQHALAQLEERLSPRYEGRERFRDAVVALVASEHVEIRRQVAWVMGREPADAYREGLARLLADDDAGVRLNAACSLSNFNDPRARPTLLNGLRAFDVPAPASGNLDIRVKAGEPASLGAALGVVEAGDETFDLRTPMNGFVERLPKGKSGSVNKGETVLVIAPDSKVIRNVLVALRFVGTLEDVARLTPYAEGTVERIGEEAAAEARTAIAAIQKRGK